MVVEIKNVLVCDAVDNSCTALLEKNGINVIIFQFNLLKHFFFSQISV